MAFTFPNYIPIYPLAETTKPIFRGSRIGNGPQNRNILGIQQFPPSQTVQWPPLSVPDANVITDFLEERIRRNEWFYWAAPGGLTRKWRCRQFGSQEEGRGLFTIRAQFAETFEVTN